MHDDPYSSTADFTTEWGVMVEADTAKLPALIVEVLQRGGIIPTEAETYAAEIVAALGIEQTLRVSHDDGAGSLWVDSEGKQQSTYRPETFHYLYRIRALESAD